VWVYLHLNFRCRLSKTHVLRNEVRKGCSRSSKVIDFGTNQKRICNFLLVINSNLFPIFPRFRDIAGFLRRVTPPLFHPNFRGVPLGLDCRCCGSEELTQHISTRCHNVTDERTDGRTTYDSNTALALLASRGKNCVL